MNKWKLSFFIVLLLLLTSNVFWLYTVVDGGVTYTYQQVSLDEKTKSLEMLGELMVKGSKEYTKKDILHLLRQTNKDSFIVEEKHSISIDGVKFIFKNGVLAKVSG